MVLEPDTGWCASEDVGPPRGWIVRSHIGWRGERNIPIRVWKPLPSRRVLKTLREFLPKETIFASGGFGLLQLGFGSVKKPIGTLFADFGLI